MRFSLCPTVPLTSCKCANIKSGVRYPWSTEMRLRSESGGGSACSGCLNNCTAIVLSIAILLSGLRATSSAPTGDQDHWWINPCNKQPQIRHGRSAESRQFKRFLLDMEHKVFKELHNLYKTNDKIDFNSSCPKINKMLKAVNSTTSLNAAMQAFYETLLQFAIFVDRLKNIPVKTQGQFDFGRRKRIFENVEGNLRLLVCEYNDTLGNQEKKRAARLHGKKHPSQPRVPKVKKIDMTCLKEQMNQTQAHVTDVDFFTKLQKFLRQSRRILKQKKTKKKNNGTGNKKTQRTRKPRV